MKLTVAQLKISQGASSKACLTPKSTEELKHKPGMVSARVAAYSRGEDTGGATKVSTQAVQWNRSHQPKSPPHLSLIREAANFKLKYGQKEEAISDLEQALENSGTTYIRKKGGKVTRQSRTKEQVDECPSDYTVVLPVIGTIVVGLCFLGLCIYSTRLRRQSDGYQRI
ncbi:Signal recognition particle 72 kDa protein [Fukomys damarensis]|uniref:Signal recognition particle 72 kDa protein n=1 Tax=Fukomys damarensis TaxID=885580 RepID=A0A091DSK6_FUKDA|nr:Signal recognition particle 72 kDa protein [Fukomys damarensis]